jgi:hypothetical protein
MKKIAETEGLKLSDSMLRKALESCGGDVRQMLNLLQMLKPTSKNLSEGNFEQRYWIFSEFQILRSRSGLERPELLFFFVILIVLFRLKGTNKEDVLGPWGIVPKLFSRGYSIDDKFGFYFMDASFIGIMVQVKKNTRWVKIPRKNSNLHLGKLFGCCHRYLFSVKGSRLNFRRRCHVYVDMRFFPSYFCELFLERIFLTFLISTCNLL